MSEVLDESIRVLSLNGGGYRGESSLHILNRVMKEIAVIKGTPDVDIKPCDYFHLIGGTSAGGIQAIMLGRLRMTVPECISAFEILGKKIFKDGKKRGPRLHQYESSCLVDAVKEILRARGMPDDEPLLDPTTNSCRTFTTTLLMESLTENDEPILFRSYSTPCAQYAKDCKIWEAIRATTAAPFVFKPMKIGKHQFMDAALGGFNDPVMAVETEAGKLWPDKNIGVFLSLGTGKRKTIGLKNKNYFQYAVDLLRILRGVTTGSESMVANLQQRLGPQVFFRLNVADGLGDIGITDWKKSSILESFTKKYLERVEIKSMVKTLAQNLINTPPVLPTLAAVRDECELYYREDVARGTWTNIRWPLDRRMEVEEIGAPGFISEMKYSYIKKHLQSIYNQIQYAIESHSKAKECYKHAILCTESDEKAEGYRKCQNYLCQANRQISSAFDSLVREYNRVEAECNKSDVELWKIEEEYKKIEADRTKSESSKRELAGQLEAGRAKTESLKLELAGIMCDGIALKVKLAEIKCDDFKSPQSGIAACLLAGQVIQSIPQHNQEMLRTILP